MAWPVDGQLSDRQIRTIVLMIHDNRLASAKGGGVYRTPAVDAWDAERTWYPNVADAADAEIMELEQAGYADLLDQPLPRPTDKPDPQTMRDLLLESNPAEVEAYFRKLLDRL